MATRRLKQKIIAVRLDDDQHERIERDAAAVGLGVSTYMRQLAITQNKKTRKVSSHE